MADTTDHHQNKTTRLMTGLAPRASQLTAAETLDAFFIVDITNGDIIIIQGP